MKRLLLGEDRIIGRFMAEALDTPHGFESGRGIGIIDVQDTGEATLLAGIWYENFNGANMMMHVAAQPNANWMSKEQLWYTFYYPFIECGCKRVTALVAESNMVSRSFVEHVGYKLEARLKDAAPDGDVLVYAMFRDECRWLKLRDQITHLRNRIN